MTHLKLNNLMFILLVRLSVLYMEWR